MANITEQLKEHHGKLRESTGGGKREITMISEGWGSSGYYSSQVLERDIPRVFPVGTKMYLNHPSTTEARERPERDLRDLVGRITSTPRMAGIDMIAECEVYEHWAPVINELANDIGISIRGDGVVEAGAAGGKEGPIVQAITDGFSVDFVTEAGAGGRVGPLIEAARGFVENETDEVSLAECDVREVSLVESAYEQLLERDVSQPERVSLAKKGQAIPVKDPKGNIVNGRFPMANCEDVGNAAVSVGRSKMPMPEIKNFIMKVAGKLSCPMPFKESGSGRSTEEAKLAEDRELSELRESVSKLEKAQEATDSKLKESEEREKGEKDRADRAEEALRLREAGAVCSEVVEGVEGLPKTAKSRVIEAALRKELPLDSDGKLDKDVLKERAEKALKDEIEYVGAVSGRGSVRGVGESARPGDSGNGEGTKEELSALEESFVSMGLSKEAAKAAAEGR